jgi:hypothetical protein
MTGFAPEVQTKQYVAEVNGAFGSRWRVFTTGSDRHYLFVLVQNPDISKPVAKADLRPDVRRALAHGHGHAPRERKQTP